VRTTVQYRRLMARLHSVGKEIIGTLLCFSLSTIKNHSFVHLDALVKWSSSVTGGGGTGNLVSRN